MTPLPVEGEELDLAAVGLEDPHAVGRGVRHVEPAVGVDAEPVAAPAGQLLDDPGPLAVDEAQQALTLDDDGGAVGLERDPVAVEEAGRRPS